MGDDGSDEHEFLTVKEVAVKLRVSAMTVYRLVNSNQLQAFKVRGSTRIHADSVDAYIRENHVKLRMR